MIRDLSYFEGLKSIVGLKGHPLSIKFRQSMDGIQTYATHMAGYIQNICNDLQEELEDERQKYEGYLKFSPEDELELERERLKLKEEGFDGDEFKNH